MKRLFTVAVVLICFSWVSYAQVTILPNPGSSTSLALNWSTGGATRLIVVRSENSTWIPTNGTTYTANTAYPSNSTTQGTSGPDWDTSGNIAAVVYKNNGASVTVTGLASSNFYTVLVYTVSGTNYTLDQSNNPAITLWFDANTSTSSSITTTYAVPSAISSVSVQAWGGGGSGGYDTNGNGFPGGGGGAYAAGSVTVSSSNTYTVTVGKGGAGGSSSGNDQTNSGGSSSFAKTNGGTTTYITAGGGGKTSSNSTNASGGTASTNSVGNPVTNTGGSGGLGGNNTSDGGGGGGASASPSCSTCTGQGGGNNNNSNGGGGGAVTGGGNGGGGGNGSSSAGDGSNPANGTFPGGGGGGRGDNNNSSLSGAGGLVTVLYSQPYINTVTASVDATGAGNLVSGTQYAKIGSTITFTVNAYVAGYLFGTFTVNSKTLTSSSFHDNADGTYTFTYTVASGDNDITTPGSLPFSITLKDASGNSSVAATNTNFSSAVANIAVDAHAPSVSSFSGPSTTVYGTSVNYSLKFDNPITQSTLIGTDFTLSGTATSTVGTLATSDGGTTWTIPIDVTSSGTINLQLNANAITDVAGNAGPTSAAATTPTSVNVVICSYPTAASSLTTIPEAGAMTINWTTASASDGSLVLIEQATTAPTDQPVDGTDYSSKIVTTSGKVQFSSAVLSSDGHVVYAASSGSTSNSVKVYGLTPNTPYSWAIYTFNTSTFCYQLVGTGNTATNVNTSNTGDAELTVASSGTPPLTISSLQNSLSSGSPQSSFSFTVTDAGADGVDGQISQIVINSGTNNQIDWTQAIASAQLFDGSNTSTVTNTNITSPSSGQYLITFPSLNTASGQIGNVPDGGTKTYTLTIALATNTGTLQSSIDGQQFDFNVATSSFTTNSFGSSVALSQSESSGVNKNVVDVAATKIIVSAQPTSAIVNAPFGAGVLTFTATDTNGNTDKDFNYSSAPTISPNDPGATGAPSSFSNGIADFSNFEFENVGSFTVSVAANSITSTSTSSITVTSTTTVAANASALATSPLINSSTDKAAFGFSLQTDGANLNLTNLTIAVNTTDAVLPLKNFKLYSGTQSDGSDATDLGLTASTSTAAITFSSISVPLTSTAKYFFLLADVNDYFYSSASKIQFSLNNSGVDLSLTGASVTGGTITGTNYDLKDNTPPQILSITNSVNLIYSGALIQTVKVVYKEPMDNATTPSITFSNGMTNWGTQAVGSWSTTTLANDTYTTTFTHNATPESDAAVTSSVTASVGAKDFGSNYLAATATSPTSFVLDNTPPTVSSVTFNPTAITTNAENLTVTIQYDKSMNTSNPSIVFSSSGANFSVSTAGTWITTNSYQITYTHNATSETVNNITIAVSGAEDTDGNPQTDLSSSATSFNIDTERPYVSSLSLNTPASSPTNATSLTYQVVFNESVSNVDAGDFVATVVSGSATTGAITVVPVSATTYNVEVASVNASSGNSQIRLDLSSTPTITDTDGNDLTQAYNSGQVYLVDQIVPQATSIAISSPTVLWSTVNGTSASSISWLVTFSENVTGVNATDFSLNSPISTDLTITTPLVVTGSGSSYTVTLNGVSLLNASANAQLYINLSASSSIVDQANNALTTGLNSSITGNEYYTILFPTPSNAGTNFNVTSQTTTDIAVQWSNPVSPAAPANYYYFQIKKNTVPSFPSLQNGVYAPDPDNDFSDGTLGGYIISTSPSIDILTKFNSTLTSGFDYDIQITSLSFSGIYSSPLQYQFDYLTSSVLMGIASTTVASTSSLVATSTPVTVSSLANAQVSAVDVLKFTVTDDGSAPSADNAPFKFNKLVVNQGSTNNVIDWTSTIAGAILSDGTNTIIGTVNTNNITFASIPSTHTTDEGYIADDGSKAYTLSVWLKNSVTDNSILNFNVNNSSFTYDNSTDAAQASQASSQLTTGQSVESGSNIIGVVATKLVYNTQPPSQIGVASNFPASIAPVVYAEDANGNLDLDYSGTATISNTNSLNQNISNKNFVSGVLTLNTLSFTSAGNTNIVVSAPSVTSTPNSTGVTAVISMLTEITLGTVAPISFPSLTTALSGAVAPQQNAVQNFEFVITDDAGANTVNFSDNDGLPTQISQIKITQGTNNDGTYLNDWTKVIAGAQLADVNGNTLVTGTVNATNLQFDFSTLSTISDNGSNTYRLKIWLRDNISSISTTIANNIDDKYFDFAVANTSITISTTANTSSKFQTSSADAGTSKNQVIVTATKLSFVTQPNSTQSYDASISPSPTAQAQDANGNLDIDYNTAASVTTSNSTTYPLANATVTVNNGNISFQPTLNVTSAGNGVNGATSYLSLSSGALANGTSSSFTLHYSANSDLIKDPSFSYTSDIPYANYQSGTFSSNSNGVALEQFLIRDGGATHSDTDGSPTVLSKITLNISNYQYLRTVALYSGSTKIAELPVAANVSNIVGNTADLAFTSLASFQANTNSSAPLTVYATFIGSGVVDQQVIEIKVTSVVAGAVGSSFGSGTSTTFPTLAAGENRLDVIATKLVFTNPSTAVNASLNSPFTPNGIGVTVQAQDANNNLDLDYNGTITNLTLATSGDATSGGPTINTSAFAGGVYTFSSGFQFTSGDNGDDVSLTMTAGAGITGTSPAITLQTSFESSLQKDPTFVIPSTINYINYQTSNIGSSPLSQSYELFRALLVDGNRTNYTYKNNSGATGTVTTTTEAGDGVANGDADGAPTNLTSLTLRIYRPSDLRKIALYDSTGTQIPGTEIDVTANGSITATSTYYDFTWNQITGTATNATLLSALDNKQSPFSVRVSFRSTSPEVNDHDNMRVQLIAATAGIGSQFFIGPLGSQNSALYAGGNSTPTGTTSVGDINVIATELDFSTSPNTNQLVLTNVTSTSATPDNSTVPVIRAKDANGITDLDYNATLTLTNAGSIAMSTNSVTMSSGIAAFPTAFQYNDAGNGTLTATSSTAAVNSLVPSSGSSSSVTVGYSNTSTMVISGTTATSISTSIYTGIPFQFTITDDGGSGGDGASTQITQIKITKNTATPNQIANWTDILDMSNVNGFGPAVLWDGTTSYKNMTVTVTANDITFSNMLSTANDANIAGYISDNGSKTFQLNLFFKPSFTGGLQAIVDHLNFDFQVDPSNVTFAAQSSTSASSQTTLDPGPIPIAVVATQLAFSTESPSDVLVNANLSTSPVVTAFDRTTAYNDGTYSYPYGNIDLDYSPTTGVSVTNTGGLSMTNIPTAFSNGVLTFPSNFQYTQIGNGTLTLSSSTSNSSGGAVSSATSTSVTVRVGVASTITAGTLTEPSTISSLADQTSAGTKVFDFTINDDPTGTPANQNDGVPTRLSKIKITQGTNNSITDWSQALAQVQLSDGTNDITGTITPDSLVFSGLANSNTGDFGHVIDDGSKTYTLTVWLKTDLNGALNYPQTIDGLKFVFDVEGANVTTNINGTAIKSGQNQNSGSSNNVIDVQATELFFTNPSTAVNASLNSPFTPNGTSVVVQAQDGNGNLDLDYTETITNLTLATSGDATSGGPIIGTDAFAAGVYTFSNSFQFTSGTNNDNVALTMAAGTGTTCGTNAICGASPTITLQTSFESSLQKDPTFVIPSTINYINYQTSNIGSSPLSQSYELFRALLVDGNRTNYTYKNNSGATGTVNTTTEAGDNVANGDGDGATTNLTSLTLRIYRPSDLRKIALYDSTGTEIPGTEIDVTANGSITATSTYYDFTWNQITGTATNATLLSALDNKQSPFSVRVSFRSTSPEVNDHDNMRVQLIDATVGIGSQFFIGPLGSQNAAAYAGGNATPMAVTFVGDIDVIATKLVFTNQPPAYAGINQPVPYPIATGASVEARDNKELLDLDLSTTNNTTANVSSAVATLTSTSFPFSNGVADLSSLMYSGVGDGTLTVSATNLPSSVTTLSNTHSNSVAVIDVTASRLTSGILQGNNDQVSIKGGLVSQSIFGVTFTPDSDPLGNSCATANQPSISKFTISFDVPYKTVSGTTTNIFKNFKVYEKQGSADVDVTNPSIGGTLTYWSSTNSSKFDRITVQFSTPRPLYSGAKSYKLVADVDVTANLSTPKITPFYKYIDYTDTTTVLTQGSIIGNFTGNTYSFASTKPPVLYTVKGSGTSPYSGQLNVSAALDTIALQFDVAVTSLDGVAQLYERSSNQLVAKFVAVDNGNFLNTTDYTTVVSPLKFKLDTLMKPLVADSVYYVKIAKGSYSPLNPIATRGTGISDQGLNFYGGISSNSILYFKIASNKPPVLDSISSTAISTQIGTLTTTFEQNGTAYFLILNHSSTIPTKAQVKNPSTYGLQTLIAASGNYSINAIASANPALSAQTWTFPANYIAGQTYDVYVYAENDAQPTPIGGNTVYYSNGSHYVTAGPTMDGTVGPTLQFTVNPTYVAPSYTICPNSYVTVTKPIVIKEGLPADFYSSSPQDFNILLPTGYQFDITSKPQVQLIGSDFSNGDTAVISFVNNSLVKIQYYNTGTTSLDNIVISNLKIYGTSGSNPGWIQRFYGSNTLGSSTEDLAYISLSQTNALTFTNSFSEENTFPSALIPSVVTAIPNNYVDQDSTITIPNSIRLLPQINTSSAHDYNSSTFSGLGITNDLLTLTAVQSNAAFNITMVHTDPNGCVQQTTEQYLVYDHNTPISKKLGTTQAVINKNFPGTTPAMISMDTILFNELAGYNLLYLSSDLPASELALNAQGKHSQKMYNDMLGTRNWSSQISKIAGPNQDIPTSLGTFENYQWDYSYILNADTLGNPSLTSVLANSPYDWFIKHPTSGTGNTYWTGGSLGKVEFTGVFQSSADLTVVMPFRQDVELFVPPVPLIEIGSSNLVKYDKADNTSNINNGNIPENNINKVVYTSTVGYPGTAIFCREGGAITFNGYPQATSGSSNGKFAIYDYSKFDFASNNNSLIVDTSNGFVDNGNGTATLDPVKITNGYNDILVVYTYQDNNSPATGTGYLVIRVTPNPTAIFTMASVIGTGSPSSSPSAFCQGNPINFDAHLSSIDSIDTINHSAPNIQPNTIVSYSWNFGDPNSGLSNAPIDTLQRGGKAGKPIKGNYIQQNASPTQTFGNPQHIFNVSSTYIVGLTLTSNWGCSSAVANDTMKVGEIPISGFSVLNNCVGDSAKFDASIKSSMPSGNLGNSSIHYYEWNYDTTTNAIMLDTLKKTSYKYGSEGIYVVKMTAISTLGCQSSTTQRVSQLPVITLLDEPFDLNGGGWQALDISGTTTDSTSWKWGAVLDSIFNTGSSNNAWSTTGSNKGSYYTKENSALYTPCLNLGSIPRPMISYDSYVDLLTGSDGLVLEYSSDNLNIFDPAKTWTVIGTDAAGTSPGIDWYNYSALTSLPGTNSFNSTSSFNSKGFGWSGRWNQFQSKHKLDSIGDKVILRFAFTSIASASLNGQYSFYGVAIDNVRVGSRTRKVLLENFTTTNSSNGSIETDDKSINDFVSLTIDQTQLVNINYHVGFLGEDPFNTDNAADQSARALYYNVNKVPYAFLDGSHSQSTSGSDLFQDWGENFYNLNTLKLAKADFSDTQAPTVQSDGSVEVTVKFTPLIDLPANSTLLQVAILEKSIVKNDLTSAQQQLITTGETQFKYVFKKMIPDAGGTRMTDALSAGSLYSKTFSWIPSKLYSDSVTVVIFLQNEITKEVYQAELFDDIVLSKVVTGIEPTVTNVNIYPVPADQELRIELPSAAVKELPIRMANEVGVFTEFGQFSEGEQNKTISTQGLSDGVYILMIGNSVRRKLVIVHK